MLSGTDMGSSRNHGGAVRHADLTGVKFDRSTDWRNAFLDASVKVPDAFRRQMGDPCQWRWAENANGGKPLTDEQFFAMWRGWIEAAPKGWNLNWQIVAPARWRHVRPIAPPSGCAWKPLNVTP
ncbi:MAG TPA: hypothetical protein ENK13_00365 [Thermopetrobacter sp.]|nr:hypothetical protein [Thermopetrobacter sp.]